MKKKFEIIEEGRLSKSDMNVLMGGDKTYACALSWLCYDVTKNCQPNTPSYSICQKSYASCDTESTNMSCNGYSGPTGPGGMVVSSPDTGSSLSFYTETSMEVASI